MRISIVSVVVSLISAGSLLAGDITPEEAGKHVGEKVTVRGVVVQAVLSKTKNGYLNFGAKYPDQVFAAAVIGTRTPALLANGPGWLTELQGKEVVVTGTVELYEGKPQIFLTSRDDVKAAPAK